MILVKVWPTHHHCHGSSCSSNWSDKLVKLCELSLGDILPPLYETRILARDSWGEFHYLRDHYFNILITKERGHSMSGNVVYIYTRQTEVNEMNVHKFLTCVFIVTQNFDVK